MMKANFDLEEKTYRCLFDNAIDAMWIYGIGGIIKDANWASERVTGYTRLELIGMNVLYILHKSSHEKAKTVEIGLLEGVNIEQPYEQQIVRKDGTIRSVDIIANMVTIDGEVVGFHNTARDVTEKKTAHVLLSEIIGGSPIPTFVIDRGHKVCHWNKALESISGLKAKDIIGTDEQWRSFYMEKRPTLADLILENAPAHEVEAYYLGKCRKSSLIEGAYEAEDFFSGIVGKWIHFTASQIKSEDGDIIGALETLVDISEEKQLEENMRLYVQQITRAQEDERKRISRELHDEMSPPLLLAIQRLDSIVSRPSLKAHATIKKSIEDLRGLTIEALEGLRRCAQDLRPRILDDLGLIPALEWMADALMKNFGIESRVEIKGTERVLSTDTQLILFRIAQEALNNVRRHSTATKAIVKLEFEVDKISMIISDNGKGFEMPPHSENLISAGKLGIIGMHERAHLLGGNLEIKSEPGKGTHVIVSMPLSSLV